MKSRIKFNSRKFDMALARANLELSELAKIADVGRNSLYNARDRGVRPHTAGKIARGLGVELSELM
jgi:hypothetical protein